MSSPQINRPKFEEKLPLYSECEKKRSFDKAHFIDELPQLIKKPFPVSFFVNLLDLEEKIFKNSQNCELLDQAVDSYMKLVNYYSNKKDPIHYYFKEKYEIVTANREALKIIKTEGAEANDQKNNPENRTSVFNRLIKGFELIPEVPGENTSESMSGSMSGLISGSNRYSLSKKKKVRQEKLKMLQEIQKKKVEEVSDMSKVMVNFLENSKNNDAVVSGDLKKQIENILAKVNQKKINSTLNNSGSANNSFRFNGNEPSEIKTMEAELTTNITMNELYSPQITINSD